jgi:hypothetical protein
VRVARGRSRGDVPADRAAVADLEAAHRRAGRSEHRKPAPDGRRAQERRVGRERPDREAFAAHADAAQRVEPPEVQEAPSGRLARGEGAVDVGGAGERHERALVAQHPERLAQRARLQQLERCERRPHRARRIAR